MQLAEMLKITNRAVSKCETGKSMPDASLMLNMVLNDFFPEINFNNLLGLPTIAITIILLAKWFFKNCEIKLK